MFRVLAFAIIARSIRQSVGPNPPLVVPFLTGPTDSRHWSAAGAKNVFRFTPFAYEQDWMSRAHGTDERISVQALADGVRFYVQLIRNAEGL
jgi:carboxypeptidase PM20D1